MKNLNLIKQFSPTLFAAPLLLVAFILIGAGCNSSSTTSPAATSTDSSSTTTTTAPVEKDYGYLDGWYYSIYACNLTDSFCDYIDPEVLNGVVDNADWGSKFLYSDESFCDDTGCFFVDQHNDEWYFDF